MNVNFEKLLKKGIADFRIMEQKQEILLNPKNKVDKSLINLDIHLANLIDDSKRCSLKIVKNIDKDDYKKKLNYEFFKNV
ncbi:hypothetical protein [Apilactobacillus ozensis]|uniref:hypothetical protein n=1 Tax=Apilactobacillus ozensis TaxID=866801 RepID=UPI0006D19EA4|nr:hypothetical protein [Apilactobacillus ozensis]